MTPSESLMNRAREALRAARYDLDGGFPEAAVNRAYYAAYYAAKAALVEQGETPRSHRGVQHRFFECFVRSGPVDRSLASTLRTAERERLKADYDTFPVSDAMAANDLINDVERFVKTVESLLDSGGDVKDSRE